MKRLLLGGFVACLAACSTPGPRSQLLSVRSLSNPAVGSAEPISAPAAPHSSEPDPGSWFSRNVYEPDGNSRRLYAIEIIYCPTERAIFSECKVAVAWSRNGKGGLSPEVGAPASSVTIEERRADPTKPEPPLPPMPPTRRRSNAVEPETGAAPESPTSDSTLAQDAKEGADRDERIAYALARRHKEKGETAEEERLYKQCLKIEPKFALCHYGLFELFLKDRRDKEAKIACQNVVKFAEPAKLQVQLDKCTRYLKSVDPANADQRN